MAPQIRLGVLGAVRLATENGAEPTSLVAQTRRVALLVYLALARPRGAQQRDSLLALFWPEYDEMRARNALNQAVHFLRRSLGAQVIVSCGDDRLTLDPELVWCDALEFEMLLDAGRTTEALELYGGALLEGFHVPDAAPELGHWLDTERERMARRYASALRDVAEEREASGDPAGAVLWWRRLAAHDPLEARAALGLMRALAASGDAAGAMQHAAIHERLMREELQAAPDARITAFVRELRARGDGGDAGRAAVAAVTRTTAPAPPDAAAANAPAAKAVPLSPLRASRIGAILAATVVLPFVFVLRLHGYRAPDGVSIGCVAVLPVENLSRDSSLGYVADALHDAVITELARYERPRVISRTSVLQYRQARRPLREIGRELGCDGIVHGSITRVGAMLRVDAQMLYAPEDRHLWAERYDGDTNDVLGLEERVSEAVARRLESVAAFATTGAPPVRRTDPLVHALYLRGRDAFRSRNPASLRLASALFHRVVSLDSSFAPGWAGLADTYRLLGGLGYAPAAYLDSARRLAAHALAVDSSASEAHASMAAILTDDGNWRGAEAEFRRAIQLQPGNDLAHHWYAVLLTILNRPEDALREVRVAHQLDPLSQALQGSLRQIQAFAGIEDRSELADTNRFVDPTHPGTLAARALNLARHHRCEEAYETNRRAQELAPDNTTMLLDLVGVDVLCGKPADARLLLTRVERRPDARMEAVDIAGVFALQRQRDSAFAWLDREQWGMQSFYLLRVSMALAPLRADPRYGALLARLGLP